MTRRHFLGISAALGSGAGRSAFGSTACAPRHGSGEPALPEGRLRARPRGAAKAGAQQTGAAPTGSAPAGTTSSGTASSGSASPGTGSASGASSNAGATAHKLEPGQHPLALSTGRDGLIYVPRDLPTASPVPLVVLLHGASGSARGIISRIVGSGLADEFKTVVLATDSRRGTWDAIGGRFGPDVTFLDSALEQTFARFTIDPTKLAIGGFSDGASYALSLGLINGDLFTHVLAFSPGFFVGDEVHGRPAIFVSHGTRDEVLPIDATSRRVVPVLKRAGYAVDYREFDGPHTVPPQIARDAFEWMRKG